MGANSQNVQQAFGSSNQIPPGPRDLYGYNFTFSSVAPNGSATQNITIEQDGNFYLTAINYTALVDAQATPIQDSTRIIPQITLQLTDQASGRNLFFNPMPLPMLGGTGDRPGRLVHPRCIQRSGTLVLSIASYDPTTTYSRIDIGLIGFKVYASNVSVG